VKLPDELLDLGDAALEYSITIIGLALGKWPESGLKIRNWQKAVKFSLSGAS